jgi:hypothetical protein
LIIGAIYLLRSGSQRLILAGHWAVVGLWFLEVVAETALGPVRVTLWGLFNFMLFAFHMNIFPIMVILVLRAHHAR